MCDKRSCRAQLATRCRLALLTPRACATSLVFPLTRQRLQSAAPCNNKPTSSYGWPRRSVAAGSREPGLA